MVAQRCERPTEQSLAADLLTLRLTGDTDMTAQDLADLLRPMIGAAAALELRAVVEQAMDAAANEVMGGW